MADKKIKPDNIDKFSEGSGISTDEFSSWLEQIRRSQKTGEPVNVPCGGCSACCISSYFIHIKPCETGTIAKIPKELMFPAPGLPAGNVLLGYNKKGHCPMFIGCKCSIYKYRPETCRTYDCRIFTATGMQPDDDKVLISRQVNRWKFKFENGRDLKEFSAVRAAARFINEHAESFPEGFIPVNSPQRALVAIKVYKVFLDHAYENEKETVLKPDQKIIKAVIDSYKNFENNMDI